jgi:U3 small nucleolar RNA-associated protein 10
MHPPVGKVKMQDVTDDDRSEKTFAKALEFISQQEIKEVSFLVEGLTSLFDPLAHAFIQASGVKAGTSNFIDLPILKRSTAMQETLYFSFFVRFFSGLYPSRARVAALRIVTSTLAEKAGKEYVDMQAILPYIISTLADPSERVRREAAKLLAVIDRAAPKSKFDGETDRNQPWGLDIYGRSARSKCIQWLPTEDMYKIIHRTILPYLEEYVLDPSQVRSVLERTFRGIAGAKTTAGNPAPKELKKSLRLKFFTFLCSHVVNTPLYEVKLRLLRVVNLVRKVASTSRTQELLPLLQRWRLLGPDDVKEIADHEHVHLSELEEQILSIVSPKDRDAAETLLSCVISQSKPTRAPFIAAVFSRLGGIWPLLEENSQVPVAITLLQISLGLSEGNETLATSCRDLLRTIDLSGPVLLNFLSQISSSMLNLENNPPAPKRRRTSQNNMVAKSTKDSKELNLAIHKMTFVLELIDGSKPENYPELTAGLFQTLTALHHMKVQVHSEMSYLFSLALGSLLAIVNKLRVPSIAHIVLNR